MVSFTKTYTYEIPEYDYDVKTFPSSYSDYVTVSDSSSLTFSLTEAGGSLTSELWIDSATGIITFRNDASNKNTYSNLKITIVASDGLGTTTGTLHITGISVVKTCGLASTTLTPDVTGVDSDTGKKYFEDIETAVNEVNWAGQGFRPYITGKIDSTNANCPADMSTATLLLGNDDASIYAGSTLFFINLYSSRNAAVGVYTFVVEVAADGGATTTASASIRMVDSPCVAVIDTDFHKSFTFDVPDSASSTCVSDDTWVDDGSDPCTWYLGRES